MSSLPLGRPYDYAVSRLHEASGDIGALPLALQTLLVVESAQGIIDNGGLEYFYEADFPDNPPYSVFVEAYRRIGAESAASCIEDTARMFPFEEPQLFEGLRQLWLEKLREDPTSEFGRLSGRICGDESVWTKLDEYVKRNQDAFAAT